MHHPIPDTHHSVERPMVKAITCQLVSNNALPRFKSFYHKNNVTPIIKQRNSKGQGSHFIFKNEGYLEALVTVEPHLVLNTGSPLDNRMYNEDPIFLDMDTRVALQPTYQHVIMEIEYRFHTTSLESLLQWKDIMGTKRMIGEDRYLHDLQYTYRLHENTTNLLREVHTAIEKKAGYGEDFSTYVHKHAIHSISETSNGNHVQLDVNEIQRDTLGILSPEITIEESDDRYIASINYKVYTKIPRTMIGIYDIQIHQTLLPNKYLPIHYKTEKRIGMLRNRAMPVMTGIKQEELFKTISLTPFDPTVISDPPPGYRPIWKALLTLDTGEPGELLANLYDIPELCIPDWMLCILTKFHNQCVLPFTSPFLFSLHHGQDLMDVTYLELDEKLNLKTRKPLDLRTNWHITMSVSQEPHIINTNAHAAVCEECPESIEPLTELIIHSTTGQTDTKLDIAKVRENGICRAPGLSLYTVESCMIKIVEEGSLNITESVRS